MKALISIALASAWNRRITLGLALLAITLATSLMLSVERIRHHAQESFSQSVSGTDLIVGARGSALQLVLHVVFRIGDAANNIEWKSYQAIAADPAVAWAVPVSLGDSHRGFPVMGTAAAYFEHFRYGPRVPLEFAAGRPFASVFEAVIGAEVATRLGYRTGDKIALSHGPGRLPGAEHADKPFTITGILKPTGTPVDRTVHVGLDGIEAIHLDWVGGAPIPGLSIEAQNVGKFDLQPKNITAIMLGLHQRSTVFRLQRKIADFRTEPLQAVLPGVVIDELWQALGVVEKLLQVISWLVLGVSLAGLVAVMLSSLAERRRELAILRANGAAAWHICTLLLLESATLGLLGASIGLGLVTLGFWLAQPILAAQWGVFVFAQHPSWPEWRLLATVVASSVLVGLWPAWRAQRLSLAEGLCPRL